MTNDEVRMTKEALDPNDEATRTSMPQIELGASSLGFRHSFVIRASSLGILSSFVIGYLI